MSGASVPAGKSRRRDKVLGILKSSSFATSSSGKHPQSSNLLQPNPPRSSSASSVQHPALTLQHAQSQPASTNPLNPVPATLPSSSNGVFRNAWQQLSDHHREVLRPYVPSTSDNSAADALEQSLAAAREKQQQCNEKRLKFTFAGRTVVLKEAADKIVQWLNRLKPVGDMVAASDPIHVGVPWTAVCFLLKAVTSESEQMAALLVGCETSLYMMNRLKAYMEFLDHVPVSQSRTNFELRLAEMYALILSFLARAIETYQRSTFRRALDNIWKGSEVQDFERDCDKVADRVEIEAQNCDRTIHSRDRMTLQQLQETLSQIHKSRIFQEAFKQLEIKIDLANLKSVQEAAFDAYEQVHQECHPETRIDLLRDIQDWARDPDSQHIFWLQGMAGTGKSTISCTIAKWLCEQGVLDTLDLGASFFFKRGEGYRGSAVLLFPTIARQLARKIPSFGEMVAQAVKDDPDICSKRLGDQFRKLILEPLKKLSSGSSKAVYIVVIDALDECRIEDIDVVLRLWSQDPPKHLKLFLTSRPDLPIRLSFDLMSTQAYRELVLQDIPPDQIKHDLSVFLKSKLAMIRAKFDHRAFGIGPLDEGWPGPKVLQELTIMANPLFIVAATICRFMDDPDGLPHEQLNIILRSSRQDGWISQMERTYLPILQQLNNPSKSHRDQARLYADFRYIVGSIVTLAEPLSKVSLAALLQIEIATIAIRLRPLSSVLQIPDNINSPIRCLHLSFGEFLVSDEISDQPFVVDSSATHRMLLTKCLELMSQPSPVGLDENMCYLSYAGQSRHELAQHAIEQRLIPAVQYSCRYWTYHAQNSAVRIADLGEVHMFLQKHFLHWLEALSLTSSIAEAITHVEVLRSLVSPYESDNLTVFLDDAQRFVLTYRYIANIAPLQLYSSAIAFAPRESIVRNTCGRAPDWKVRRIDMPKTWSTELQQLEGHKGIVNEVVFSPDGSQLASASNDMTIRTWDIKTGQELQKLEGHTEPVERLVFSPSGRLIASTSSIGSTRIWDANTGHKIHDLKEHLSRQLLKFSADDTLLITMTQNDSVQLWDTKTGQRAHTTADTAALFASKLFARLLHSESLCGRDCHILLYDATDREVQRLSGHAYWIEHVVISPDGSRLVTIDEIGMFCLWDLKSGQVLQKIEERTVSALSVLAISPDNSQLATATQGLLQLWDVKTGQEIHKLEGHTARILTLAFSPGGDILASAGADFAVRLWDVPVRAKRKLSGARERELQKLNTSFGKVIAMAMSPGGNQLIAAVGESTIRIYNATTGEIVHELAGYTVATVIFSLDGTQLASAKLGCTVQLWDVKTGRELWSVEDLSWPDFGGQAHTHTLAFSPSGHRLALAVDTQFGIRLRVWDARTREIIQTLPNDANSVLAGPHSHHWTSSHPSNWRFFRTLRFSSDSQAILSSLGSIPIDSPSSEFLENLNLGLEADEEEGAEVEDAHRGLEVRADWIYYRGKKQLWLPPVYRTDMTLVRDNLVVLGGQTGVVTFIHYKGV